MTETNEELITRMRSATRAEAPYLPWSAAAFKLAVPELCDRLEAADARIERFDAAVRETIEWSDDLLNCVHDCSCEHGLPFRIEQSLFASLALQPGDLEP